MDIQEKLGEYIYDKGIKLTWISEKVMELDPGVNFTDKKLSASLLGNRRLTLVEFFLICNVLNVNSDMFNVLDDKDNKS